MVAPSAHASFLFVVIGHGCLPRVTMDVRCSGVEHLAEIVVLPRSDERESETNVSQYRKQSAEYLRVGVCRWQHIVAHTVEPPGRDGTTPGLPGGRPYICGLMTPRDTSLP